MRRALTLLFVASGFLPLLGLFSNPPETTPLVYTAYVAAYLARPRIARLIDRAPGPAALHLLLASWAAGALTEYLAWLNNYLKAAPEPALFHPQLLADWIVGVGFYGGWGVAWLLVLRRFRFTVAETFVVTGLQGIFFEQLGQVFAQMLSMLSTRPGLSLLFGLYVFVVHGSAVGLAMVPVLHRFDDPGRSQSWWRFVAAIVLMVGLAFAGCWLVTAVADLLGGLPPKRSITEHPYW